MEVKRRIARKSTMKSLDKVFKSKDIFFFCDGDIEITALFAMCNNCTYMLLFNKFSYLF